MFVILHLIELIRFLITYKMYTYFTCEIPNNNLHKQRFHACKYTSAYSNSESVVGKQSAAFGLVSVKINFETNTRRHRSTFGHYLCAFLFNCISNYTISRGNRGIPSIIRNEFDIQRFAVRQ